MHEVVDVIHGKRCKHSACLETRVLQGRLIFLYLQFVPNYLKSTSQPPPHPPFSPKTLSKSYFEMGLVSILLGYHWVHTLVRPRAPQVLGGKKKKTLELNCLQINSAVNFILFVPARFSGAARWMFIHKVNIHVRCFVYKNAKPGLWPLASVK